MPPPRDELDRILHDLRGPLNAAVMHLQVLRRSLGADAGTLDTVTLIQQEISRLATMLPAAFEVIALERGAAARVNLGSLVTRTLRDHGLASVDLQPGPWPEVTVDPDLLGLAIAHLVRNALAATQAAGRTVRSPRVGFESAANGTVTLVVRDWGPGLRSVNPQVLIRLAGIGLLTVQRVARLHGGELSFADPGDGAEVRVTLPAVPQ